MLRIITPVLVFLLGGISTSFAADGQDPGHGHAHAPDVPSIAVTQWTDTMELFMEYPSLVADHSGRFIIHLTVLDGFQPVREGSVTLLFKGPTGTSHRVFAGDLMREGIFAPSVTLPGAGTYSLEISYRGPEATGSFPVSTITVHDTAESAMATDGADATGDIALLKEQQWKIPFATSEAVIRDINRTAWAIGEVLPSPQAFVEIVAPVDGVIQASDNRDLALPGSHVSRGDVVARIAPPLQGNGWASSQLALAQAKRNYERAVRLKEKDAISARDFEEAENEYLARKAGHERLAGGDNEGILALTAPINGQVIDWQVHPGQRLRAGDRMMSIADPQTVWLKVNVYENDFRELGIPIGVHVHSGGRDGGWTIPTEDLKVLTSGGALDPVTRTIPVLIEVSNPAGRLTIYEKTPVELIASDGAKATAVPRSAINEDEGMDVVFVQIGGESFAKRIVRLGPRHGNWVSILEGLEPGERVVVQGGYHVKLASTSAEIGHGHAH
jgi:RND family efflux transporter MFP subunit